VITMIAAVDRNNAIGNDGKFLCELPGHQKFVAEQIEGKTVLMGRKTFVAYGEKPLEECVNFVCTSQPALCNFHYKDLLEESSDLFFDVPLYYEFLMKESSNKEFVVLGGKQLYERYLMQTSRLYLIRINHVFEEADTHFPELDMNRWKVVDVKHFFKDKENEYDYTIYTYERTV